MKLNFMLLPLLILCLYPTSAYAYLDPGSGNALVYLIISLFGTVIYFTKNVYYKIFGKKNNSTNVNLDIKDEHEKILIFSEGKIYWFTFKPIIEALIQKKIPFSYVTMDIHDPALEIESDYMFARYIGTGSVAYAKIANKKALLMIATTPNIGNSNFPLPRPKHISCLAHVFHSVSDISMYHKGSLDYYDAVFLIGPQIEKSIRDLETLRNLTAKECVALGLPYFDVLAESIEKRIEPNDSQVILLAPSWGDKSCIHLCGTKFIHDIAQANYQLIIRPHPYSFKVEAEVIAMLKNELSCYSNVSFDEDINPSASFQKSDLLISDKSGVRFDFALLYERPVISIDAKIKNIELYEYADLDECWEDTVQAELGAVLSHAENLDILPVIEKTLSMPATHFIKLRSKYISNYKSSGEAIANWSKEKIASLAQVQNKN